MPRTIYLCMVAAMASVAGSADAASKYQQKVEAIFEQVRNDLQGNDRQQTDHPGRPDFDPLARARDKLSDWAAVPTEEQLARRITVRAVENTRRPRAIVTSEGSVHQYFPRLKQTLVFPARAKTAGAIRRMAYGKVSAKPNYCARTMREALGWGLGDAAQWVALTKRGYQQRPANVGALPGDILVWPFTFGRRRSQHIGVAVGTSPGMKLLSNLSGKLGLSKILPGYRAFWG